MSNANNKPTPKFKMGDILRASSYAAGRDNHLIGPVITIKWGWSQRDDTIFPCWSYELDFPDASGFPVVWFPEVYLRLELTTESTETPEVIAARNGYESDLARMKAQYDRQRVDRYNEFQNEIQIAERMATITVDDLKTQGWEIVDTDGTTSFIGDGPNLQPVNLNQHITVYTDWMKKPSPAFNIELAWYNTRRWVAIQQLVATKRK